jgi:transposase-like protein|tara:strand:- start:267 stop:521 length:255 start_codon:yes stop_codon:yes gene_type:complete
MEVKEEEVQTPKEPVQTPKVFSLEIENIAKDKKITHMDAVLLYCYKNGIEPDKVSSLITKALKEKIEVNARDLNFLPKMAQLPI